MESKFSFGDKIYYVDKKNDAEVEGYVIEDFESAGERVYKIKNRHERRISFVKENGVVAIMPEYWESLEENLKNDDMENILNSKLEIDDISEEAHEKNDDLQ